MIKLKEGYGEVSYGTTLRFYDNPDGYWTEHTFEVGENNELTKVGEIQRKDEVGEMFVVSMEDWKITKVNNEEDG
jgi:hypothetical protein